MLIEAATAGRTVLVRMNPGDDVVLALRDAVARAGIHNGAIVNGIGSLSTYRVHVVKTTALPPGDVFFEGEGPFDIVSLTGFVLAGRVHAHITVSNTERAMDGHLEEGCRVLTFCVVSLAELLGPDIGAWDRVGALAGSG